MEYDTVGSGPRPAEISEEEVQAASEGRSKDVLQGVDEPIELSEEEVLAASEGGSRKVFKGRLKERGEG